MTYIPANKLITTSVDCENDTLVTLYTAPTDKSFVVTDIIFIATDYVGTDTSEKFLNADLAMYSTPAPPNPGFTDWTYIAGGAFESLNHEGLDLPPGATNAAKFSFGETATSYFAQAVSLTPGTVVTGTIQAKCNGSSGQAKMYNIILNGSWYAASQIWNFGTVNWDTWTGSVGTGQYKQHNLTTNYTEYNLTGVAPTIVPANGVICPHWGAYGQVSDDVYMGLPSLKYSGGSNTFECSIGTNATDYDNYGASYTSFFTATGDVSSFTLALATPNYPVVFTGENLKLQVITPASDTCVMMVHVWGYEIPNIT